MASIAVVGAGLSGLRCATLLQASGHDVQVFERSKQIGGRMQTDVVDGFLLDHGFHVMQTGYPASQRAFNFQTMEAKAFEPGAIVVEQKNNRHQILDHGRSISTSATGPFEWPQQICFPP